MSLQDQKRRSLLSRLSRQLGYTAPALALIAGTAAFQAVASDEATQAGFSAYQEETLLLASMHAEGETEGEGEDEEKHEGEGEEEHEAEGEGEGEAEAS